MDQWRAGGIVVVGHVQWAVEQQCNIVQYMYMLKYYMAVYK